MTKLRDNRTFIFLISGRTVTSLGDSLFIVAAMWLIYELTGSAAYTGIAGFLIRVPRTLRFLAGPLVDRWRTRRVLVTTQIINGSLMLILPLAAVTGHLSVWILLTILPTIHLVNQFVYPVQDKALPQIVTEENLVRANSIFRMAQQATDMIFKAAGGVLIAAVGAAVLFGVNALSFYVAALLFAGVVVPAAATGDEESESPGETEDDSSETDADDESEDTNYFFDLREGLRYMRGSVLLLLILGAMGGNFAMGAMYAVLPAFGDLLGGSEVYGLLMSGMAAGILAGSVAADVVDDAPVGGVVVATQIFAGVFLIGTVSAPHYLLAVALFFLAFASLGLFNVMSWAMMQSAVDNSMLGRVMSAATSASAVMSPVGSLVGGVGSDVFGSPVVLFGTGVTFVLLGLYFVLRPRIRTLPKVAAVDEQMLDLGTNPR